MLESIALLWICGLLLGFCAKKLHLPALTGMIAAGLLLGSEVFGLLDESLLSISAQMRQFALVIILLRAGLSLDVASLKKAGRPALMLCFVPASAELLGVLLLAPPIFGVSRMEAALIGAVLAAVSPAVVVPRMLKLIEEQHGTAHQIPQMILAGASADDVYVMVLFSAFSGILAGKSASVLDFVQIPTSILLGGLCGIIGGMFLSYLLQKCHIEGNVPVILLLSAAFLLMGIQTRTEQSIRISGMIGVMTLGMTLAAKNQASAKECASSCNAVWSAAELLLFGLVGAAVQLDSIPKYGAKALILVFLALGFRMLGVLLSMLGTKLTWRERLFCMLAYTPKATVQAAIGAIPLAMGLPCGDLVLAVAFIAILLTAPLGAWAIDLTSPKLLDKSSES